MYFHILSRHVTVVLYYFGIGQVSACMPGAFMCSVFNTCGGIDFLQYWTIRCRIQVSYMYQMYRESLGGISAVSQLTLMSLVCAVSRPPGPTYPIPTLLAYYPYYCILPLPPLLATTPTTLQNGSDTPRNGYTYLSCIVMYFRTFPPSRNISCHPYVIHVHCT